jgi:hypothetical protein
MYECLLCPHHLSALIVSSIQFAAAPPSDEFLHPVAVQVIGEDGGCLEVENSWIMLKIHLVLRFDPPPACGFFIHPNRAVGQSIAESRRRRRRPRRKGRARNLPS